MEMKIGAGMIPMDIAYTLVMWAAGAVGVYTSVRLGNQNAHWRGGVAARWVMSLGFLVVASKVTMTLLTVGDLPISVPAAVGHFMVALGYMGVALNRVATERKDRDSPETQIDGSDAW